MNAGFKSVTTGQLKVMSATQITHNFPQQTYIYNAFEKSLDGEFDYESSFNGIEQLKSELSRQLSADQGYSHILVMSMGWNNDQVESVWRYNLLSENIQAAALESGDSHFNPLIISFTWPSAWATISDSWLMRTAGHLFSYPNKANDADEIGFTLANWIINKVVPEAIDQAPVEKQPKLVVIGHSFGARLTSRAVFSADFIQPHLKPQKKVDLFLGLQGAFSANRFIPGGGAEGSPYSDFRSLPTRFVLTTSEYDTANPVAHWVTRASHVGGEYGLEKALEHKEIFSFEHWDESNYEQISLAKNHVLMIDAKAIVNKHNAQGVSGHNDILDMQMGRLIWHFIKQI